jgi:putative NADH-flavin reductase
MKILVSGATGAIGSRIVNEALSRGHSVTALARNTQNLTPKANLTVVAADAADAANLTRLAAGQDALVSATSPRAQGGNENYMATTRAMLQAAGQTGLPVLFVGGASSLETSPGKLLIDDLRSVLAPEQLAEPLVGMQVREVIFASPARWIYLSPAGNIAPSERTGKFRLGGRQVVTAADGTRRISMEDFAVAVIDELENPQHLRQQFNAGY